MDDTELPFCGASLWNCQNMAESAFYYVYFILLKQKG